MLHDAVDHELREPCRLDGRAAGAEEQTDGLSSEATSDEAEVRVGGKIKQLLVVDHMHEGSFLCGVCQQEENSDADKESVQSRAFRQAEGYRKCLALGRWEGIEPIEYGCPQQV